MLRGSDISNTSRYDAVSWHCSTAIRMQDSVNLSGHRVLARVGVTEQPRHGRSVIILIDQNELSRSIGTTILPQIDSSSRACTACKCEYHIRNPAQQPSRCQPSYIRCSCSLARMSTLIVPFQHTKQDSICLRRRARIAPSLLCRRSSISPGKTNMFPRGFKNGRKAGRRRTRSGNTCKNALFNPVQAMSEKRPSCQILTRLLYAQVLDRR